MGSAPPLLQVILLLGSLVLVAAPYWRRYRGDPRKRRTMIGAAIVLLVALAAAFIYTGGRVS